MSDSQVCVESENALTHLEPFYCWINSSSHVVVVASMLYWIGLPTK
jgi:hypothetical protein